MLGNVKNQMTSWIGGGIASLRKTSEGEAVPAKTEVPPDSPVSETSVKGSIKEKDDDDNSRLVADRCFILVRMYLIQFNLLLHY